MKIGCAGYKPVSHKDPEQQSIEKLHLFLAVLMIPWLFLLFHFFRTNIVYFHLYDGLQGVFQDCEHDSEIIYN